MIEHILVATDGSEKAREAVAIAASLAKAVDARLTILHVVFHGPRTTEVGRLAGPEHPVHAMATMPRFPRPTEELFQASGSDIGERAEIMGERIAEEAANEAQSAGAAEVATRVEAGDYADTIVAVAKEIGADMIVVGSRGLGRFKGAFMGSVSRKVTRQAHCSVMIVR